MQQKKYLLILLFLLTTFFVSAQNRDYLKYKPIPDDGGDPAVANIDSVRSWVLNILHFGGGMIDTNSIRYVGDPRAFCRFWNGDGNWSELGWNTGLGLSTGDLKLLETPANTSGYADLIDFGRPGDTSLFEMYKRIFKPPNFDTVPTMSIHTGDAAYIQFDYQPYDTVITIEYIFASDEYPFSNPQYDANITDTKEWSIDNMNDFFGIFISGIGTPPQNMLPLNNVPYVTPQGNHVELPMCAATLNKDNTSEFFHPNPPPLGAGPGFEFDGYTSVSPNADPPPPNNNKRELRTLKIEKKVTRCSRKTIKIAIEDYLYHFPNEDPGFYVNSTVFLKKGALRGGRSKPGWKVTKKVWKGLGLEGKLIEPNQAFSKGCNYLEVTFQLDFPPGGTDTIYSIPFTIDNNCRNLVYVIDSTHNNDTLSIDTLYFGPTETTKTIRLITHDLSFEQIKNCKFSYPANPCEYDNPFGGAYSGHINLELIDNSPIEFDFEPSPGYKEYEAYCKETIDIRIDSADGQPVTHGGVKPLYYIWPDGPIPPEAVYSYTVNANPDYVPVTVNDRCLNESATQVKIVNKPIVLKKIQSIFLCGPGQEATVPVQTIIPNPVDMPGYEISHVVWERQDPPPPLPLGDQDGDSITVVYDNVVGDAIWTCGYTATDICGGTADSTFTVNQSSLVLENIGVCKGDSIELTTGTPAHWYKWYRYNLSGDSVLVGENQTTYDINYPLGQAQIVYKLFIEDNCGERQNAEMTVFVDTYEPEITYNPEDEICYGEDITLEANDSSTSSVSYTWLNGSDVVGNNQTITFGQADYNSPGIYNYTLNTVSQSNYFYCVNSADAHFTVHANPSSAFSVDPPEHACTKTDITFDYDDDIANKTFLWDFDDGNTNTQPHTTHQYTDPGSYNVNLAIELTYPQPTGHTCSSDSTFVLTVDPLPKPDFSANPTEGCEPLFVQFTDQSQDILPGAIYSWQFGDGTSGNETSPSHNYDSYGKYPITLKVSNTERCFVEINKPDYITVNPNPKANFVADPWITTMDNPVIVFIDSTMSIDGIDVYDWDFGDGDNSSEQDPEHTYAQAGDYTVTLLVKTDKSCPDTITKLVSVTEFVVLYIPSAFRPGSTIAENRVFTIKGTAMVDYSLYIFDRYGQQVWSSHNFEDYWDGTNMAGQDVPAGTYIYKIEGTDYKKRHILYKGNVTLIR